MRLSPIYDVTAMQFFMGDVISELTHWDEEHRDLSSRVDWLAQTTKRARDEILLELKKFTRHCRRLETRMTAIGIPKDIIDRSRPERERLQNALEKMT